jgi:hypothetical protein
MSKLHLRIFDGSRQLFSAPAQFLVTITDGTQTQRVRDFFPENQILFDLPFFDNFGDNYTVVVFAQGFRQAGFTPVRLSDRSPVTLDVMLVADNPGFNFANASFAAASALYPFLGSDVDPATGLARYNGLLEGSPKVLACILNLGEAMGQIHLGQGTPLAYIKQLLWTPPFAPAQDRFFAWCDRALIAQVQAGAAAGEFAAEADPGLLHPGATSSWKQIQFGEANVQLTFHENNTALIGGVDCIILEPDIDYFKDPLAHILLEVVPNAITHSLTNPVEVYVLRWIAGQVAAIQGGAPEFAPLYTLTS